MSDARAVSVLSDGTIVRLVEEGRIRIDPWDPGAGPARERGPAAGRLLPRLPQPPRLGHRPARSAARTSPRRSRSAAGRAVRDPPRRVRARAHAGVGGAARRHRRPHRGQVVASAGSGLIVHATAGFCDPGWKGTLTLELTNLTRIPIRLYAGLPIAQLSFMTLDRAGRCAPTAAPSSAATTRASVEATESRYEGAPPLPVRVGSPADAAGRCSRARRRRVGRQAEPSKTAFYIVGGRSRGLGGGRLGCLGLHAPELPGLRGRAPRASWPSRVLVVLGAMSTARHHLG